jgi:hypothetical protein
MIRQTRALFAVEDYAVPKVCLPQLKRTFGSNRMVRGPGASWLRELATEAAPQMCFGFTQSV